MNIDAESREILRYISQDFVMLTANGEQRAYHIESGDIFGQKGFIKYCSKHYGEITIIQGDGKEERAASGAIWWNWEDPLQRVARRVVMEPTSKPEHEGNPEMFNLWYERKKTMCPPNLNATPESIEIFVKHLLYLADDDEVVVMYFLNWLATLYQTPEIKIPSAFLFYSKLGGVGKSMLFKLLAQVFGPIMVGTCSGRALTKSFDDVTEHKRLLFINEMARSEKADGYENFKNMISEEQVSFEGKGRAAKDIVNITHYIVTTNNKDALPLMQSDRRIAVFMCNATPKPDAYYIRLRAWMENEGPSLVAGVLAQWKFPADWNPYAPVPQTAAARAMQDAAQGELYGVVKELIDQRREPFDKDIIVVGEAATKLNNMGLALTKPANITSLGKVLKVLCGEPEPLRILKRETGKSMPLNVYLIRNAEQWKAASAEQRMNHLDTGVHLFPVQDQSDDSEAANHE
ncbi:primase-helicase family protein [Pseudomonas sp. B10(2017)]|uniref:primase-helicase family protein n=1 Tax=Pseudomonas sp. B10(2017) TaxID=1981749 RepID=UPI00117BC992|nr:primase-helicase family protein [Pseudomonas sp. B10(2017)]